MSEAKSTAGVGGAPLFCGAMKSAAKYKDFAGGALVPRSEIDAVIAHDNIRWRRRWYLYPLGYGLLVELFWPVLRRMAARSLFAAWEAHAKAWLSRWWSEIEAITGRGAGAEAVVQSWLDTLCKERAQGHMQSWMPSWIGIKSIVLPPTDLNDSSQEIDNLLVTEHGIYVIEVKGWRSIGEDGKGKTASGESLGSPVAQCSKKVEHIKAIVGIGVPVSALAVLPFARESDAAFGLDSRIVFSSDQLAIILRTAHKRMLRTGVRRVDVEGASRAIMARMDTQDGAKVRHMLWLAEHHPSPDALRVQELLAKDAALRGDLSDPLVFEEKRRRPLGLFVAVFASLLLYVGWTDPLAYERHGIQFPKIERPSAQVDAKPQNSSKNATQKKPAADKTSTTVRRPQTKPPQSKPQ